MLHHRRNPETYLRLEEPCCFMEDPSPQRKKEEAAGGWRLPEGYGLQVAGDVEVSGLVHKGPSPVSGSGRLIIARGPA